MESVEAASNLDSVIHKTSEDFAEFLKISSASYATSIEDSMEAVLSRLDELYGMLDMIRSDNNLVIDNLLPQVRTSMATLEPIFQRIDRLEEFVQMVKGNVDVVEKEVRLAEKDYGTLNSIKKVMSGLSIFGSKKKENRQPRVPSSSALYAAPNIFSADEWFERENEKEETSKEPENVEEFERENEKEETSKEPENVEEFERENEKEETSKEPENVQEFERENEKEETSKESENVQEKVQVTAEDTLSEEYELVDCTSSLVRVNQT